MGHVELQKVHYVLPDGRVLLDDVSFRVGDGAKAALVGPNGAGKTTLLRLVSGDLAPTEGSIVRSGGLGVMRQFIGHARDDSTVRDLMVSLAPPRLRAAAEKLERTENRLIEQEDDATQLAYAEAIAEYTDAGGYDAEVLWDVCCTAAIGVPYDRARFRELRKLSGGQQKRLALEALLRGPDQVLLLDEPDNYLDVPGKQWLEEQIRETPKSVLFVTHDRELLHRTANRIVTVELGAVGNRTWVHGGGFATYDQAREDRTSRLDELRRRWDEDRAKLVRLVQTLKQKASYNDNMSARYQAAQTRLRKFEEAGPPEAVPRKQRVQVKLAGGRTGKRAVVCEDLAMDGLTKSFTSEIRYGERIAVLGANGTGKSHFLRLLARGGSDDVPVPDQEALTPVAHTGLARLGARVVPGMFAQTHEHPEFAGRTLLELLMGGGERRAGMTREQASRLLARYDIVQAAQRPFDTLSGGQQARFQILLLELEGANLLLLDEPTDNLDLVSADALQAGLDEFDGTVVAVTHDRWFARSFDRFLVFHADGRVRESAEPVWQEEAR
ncbi:ATPase components of ABC transporters with duplicated ATPase domains [Saccharopolyspora kobensis]|uniref:ATPase components of ABC transporters with duplicated ATPase domains n=1 Tax=Saccharopolyspora kobensis TaxID=146035 RepID=A0A1H6AUA3_9PSEU|nr:ATP-binding cassette domain-containing protein [Saccharopolyspora kobensis]SEG52223.1 ATPase components of ABC transporters with duplicated ATPase domains [Saccharopolyspora kobensis]SFE79295.1 ATPase components of ABC transporters with duplicated ATPase domains [Saccharopolyspora kobensis]